MVSWWHARLLQMLLLQMLVPHSSGPCTMYLYFPMKIDDREPVVVVNENGAIYLPIEIVVLMVMLVVLALPNNNRSRSSSI